MFKNVVLVVILAGCCSAALLMLAMGNVFAKVEEDKAIRATVQQYFDGIIQYDEQALRTAFHPDAAVIGTKDDGALDWQAFQNWVLYTRGDAPDPTGRINRILSIDISGNAAVVKTELDWPRVRYIDYLSLMKIDGEWKIVNKIWHREKRQEARGG